MRNIFIDTNIFIRFLIGDNEKMAEETRKLLELIEKGKLRGETDIVVIAEIVWTLNSFFKVKKEEVVESINLLLNLKNLTIKNKEIIERAINIYSKTNIDFIDAFCAATSLKAKIDYVCSYDKDYDKIEGVRRVEPSDLTG